MRGCEKRDRSGEECSHGKSDDAPLDLLEDDDDGVIEIMLLLDEDEKKKDKLRTGCIVLLITAGCVFGAGWWMTRTLFS